MARIFITGDCHASYTKLGLKSFPESRNLTKDDYVIICGDFGLWDESPEQNYWMNWLPIRLRLHLSVQLCRSALRSGFDWSTGRAEMC